MEVKFVCLREGVPCDALQFIQDYKAAVNEKNDIVEVGVETAIQFAEGDAVRISNIDFQVPKLTDADTAFRAPLSLARE